MTRAVLAGLALAALGGCTSECAREEEAESKLSCCADVEADTPSHEVRHWLDRRFCHSPEVADEVRKALEKAAAKPKFVYESQIMRVSSECAFLLPAVRVGLAPELRMQVLATCCHSRGGANCSMAEWREAAGYGPRPPPEWFDCVLRRSELQRVDCCIGAQRLGWLRSYDKVYCESPELTNDVRIGVQMAELEPERRPVHCSGPLAAVSAGLAQDIKPWVAELCCTHPPEPGCREAGLLPPVPRRRAAAKRRVPRTNPLDASRRQR